MDDKLQTPTYIGLSAARVGGWGRGGVRKEGETGEEGGGVA